MDCLTRRDIRMLNSALRHISSNDSISRGYFTDEFGVSTYENDRLFRLLNHGEKIAFGGTSGTPLLVDSELARIYLRKKHFRAVWRKSAWTRNKDWIVTAGIIVGIIAGLCTIYDVFAKLLL